VYPPYVAKAEKIGCSKAEVDEIIRRLTDYTQKKLDVQIDKGATFEDFFDQAPALKSAGELVTGVVRGVLLEDVDEPVMRFIRQRDTMVDELAKGKKNGKNPAHLTGTPSNTGLSAVEAAKECDCRARAWVLPYTPYT
jgi:hypothetical protein